MMIDRKQQYNLTSFNEKDLNMNEIPNGTYILPPRISIKEMFGSNNNYLGDLESKTNTTILFNRNLRQIEIWGLNRNVDQVKSVLANRVESIFLKTDDRRRRTGKWARPLDAKALKKEMERTLEEEEKKKKLEKFLSRDNCYALYNFTIIIPKEIEKDKDFKYESDFLNQLRLEFEVWIRKKIQISGITLLGEYEENVIMARKKLENLISEKIFKIAPPEVRNFMEVDSGVKDVEIRKIYNHSRLPFNVSCIGLLVSANDLKESNSKNNEDKKQIRLSNLRSLKTLKSGFRAALVHSGILRLSLRLGKVCFTKLPNKLEFTLEDFRKKVLPSPNFNSDFSRNIFYDIQKINELNLLLSKEGKMFHGFPQTTYAIKCDTYQLFSAKDINMDLHIENGKIKWYNVISPYETITALNWCSIEDQTPLDFQVHFEKAITLDHHLPELKLFAQSLSLNPDGQLEYSNSNSVKVKSFIKKNKWLFDVEGYIFELSENEIWIIEPRFFNKSYNNVLQTLSQKPNNHTYGLKIYKERWNQSFSQNIDLKTGIKAGYDYKNILTQAEYNELIKLAYIWINKIHSLSVKDTP